MPNGLPVSRLIKVNVNLTPLAAQFLNFDSLLIAGDSDVIDVSERIRSYGSLNEVASDFGTVVPEYLAAELFFSQVPQPSQLYIGRWAQSATHGLLYGAYLSASEKLLANWTAITDGSFKISVDGGAAADVTGLDFHLQTNLNGVATVIATAMANAGCTWDGNRFTLKSDTTGTNSKFGFATTAGSGTDISAMLKFTAAFATPVDGIGAETALQATVILDDQRTAWYGLMFASTHIVDADHVAIAGFVEGSGNPHIYGLTTTNPSVPDSTHTDDIASLLSAAGYLRAFCQFSENAYAVASFFGRAFTVDFNANNTTITMMYKQEPGIAPEGLSTSQADTLQAKRCNVFVQYNNSTAIIEYGVMSGPAYFDEIHGLDWLRDQIQTDVYNLLYTSPTKIPQTDPGTHQITTAVEAACDAGVNNGLIAPGVWNSAGFGQLKQGDLLSKGYYVYAPPVATQAQANREARKSVPIQVAVKLAGAIHTVDITVLVNR